MDWQTWGPPLVVLSIGIAVGLGLALISGGQRAVEDDRLARREELTAQKATLLDQIRSLDADRDKLGEAEYARRRQELVGQAAKVLAALEALEAMPVEELAVERELANDGASSNPLAAGLWAAGVLLFFGMLAVFLSSSSTERAQGGSMTGGAVSSAANASAEIVAAKDALEADPNDLKAINTLSYDALLNRDLENAMQLVDRARAIDPDDPDLHVHLAILQISVGMVDKADVELARAIEQRPKWGRPRLWRGLVRMYESKPEETIVEVEAALQLGLRADEQGFARQLLSDARNPRPAPTGEAQPSSAPAGPMYAGAGGGAVQLTGTIAKPVAELPADRVVFLVVYSNAQAKAPPPPVATARLTVADLPFTFKFEEGHSMTGGPWPSEVWIRAKVDVDGRPGPSSPDDIDSVLLGPVKPGTEGLEIEFP